MQPSGGNRECSMPLGLSSSSDDLKTFGCGSLAPTSGSYRLSKTPKSDDPRGLGNKNQTEPQNVGSSMTLHPGSSFVEITSSPTGQTSLSSF
jgi:hypothetical protein